MQNDDQEINVINSNSLQLRSQSITLSKQKVIDMIRKYDFYDEDKNPKGKGFLHKYILQEKNGNKIVIDAETNLMWQRSGATYKIESGDAKNCIKELNKKGYAGYNDWRLPTLEEAMSLIEREKPNDGLHINPLFDKKQNWIWTSDSCENGARVWYVSFLSGSCGNIHLFNYGYDYVRAVRSLQ
jgi:hypothetical protein